MSLEDLLRPPEGASNTHMAPRGQLAFPQEQVEGVNLAVEEGSGRVQVEVALRAPWLKLVFQLDDKAAKALGSALLAPRLKVPQPAPGNLRPV